MLLEKAKEKKVKLSKFIDFDREKCLFYDNIYLDEEKLVIKQPIVCKRAMRDEIYEGIKLEKFNLAKYTFLTSYE